MKLEHLIEAYRFNKIEVNAKGTHRDEKESAGVLAFNNNINASYMIDKEDIVTDINIFSNCVITDNIIEQINHTIETIKVIQKTIELIGNIKQGEANNILNKLGMFDRKLIKKIDGNDIRYNNHIYKLSHGNGILLFSISENNIEI